MIWLVLDTGAEPLELLHGLQTRHGFAYLFISHDLRVVRALAHESLVMKDIRLKLFKIGALVRVSVRRIKIAMARPASAETSSPSPIRG